MTELDRFVRPESRPPLRQHWHHTTSDRYVCVIYHGNAVIAADESVAARAAIVTPCGMRGWEAAGWRSGQRFSTGRLSREASDHAMRSLRGVPLRRVGSPPGGDTVAVSTQVAPDAQ